MKHPKSGDLVKFSFDRERFDGRLIILGMFLSSRPTKWGNDYFRYKILTDRKVEEILVWVYDFVEIINETR